MLVSRHLAARLARSRKHEKLELAPGLQALGSRDARRLKEDDASGPLHEKIGAARKQRLATLNLAILRPNRLGRKRPSARARGLGYEAAVVKRELGCRGAEAAGAQMGIGQTVSERFADRGQKLS